MHIRRDRPGAYFLTWSAYGTWLPGDARGSVDDSHNGFGTPPAPPDEQREGIALDVMRFPPMHLNAAVRDVVERTILDHCGVKKWALLALNVRTNHVHAVVDCGSVNPDVALEQFKAWCTRRLREAKLVGPERSVWTRRGSTRYCWKPED